MVPPTHLRILGEILEDVSVFGKRDVKRSSGSIRGIFLLTTERLSLTRNHPDHVVARQRHDVTEVLIAAEQG